MPKLPSGSAGHLETPDARSWTSHRTTSDQCRVGPPRHHCGHGAGVETSVKAMIAHDRETRHRSHGIDGYFFFTAAHRAFAAAASFARCSAEIGLRFFFAGASTVAFAGAFDVAGASPLIFAQRAF